MIFDTGSPLIWIPSIKCDDECPGATSRFDIKKSSSCHPDESNRLNVEYLAGKIEGDVVRDTVSFQDKKVTDQPIGVATHVVQNMLSDGISELNATIQLCMHLAHYDDLYRWACWLCAQ